MRFELKNIQGGCWRGYERVPGTIEFSKGSCRKIGSAATGSRASTRAAAAAIADPVRADLGRSAAAGERAALVDLVGALGE